MNILCIGDIVGKPGRKAIEELLPGIVEDYSISFVIANAENAAGGAGVTSRIAKTLFKYGCDVITLGDHVWDQKEVEDYLREEPYIIRPLNLPPEVPGKGWCIKETPGGKKIGVVTLLGRVFMKMQSDCPFRAAKEIISVIRKETPIIIVDMHAEATSEKSALGHFLDGNVTAVVGTHTHIQTADEKILPKGTAYLTDIGMTGPYDSVIGQNKEKIINRFLTGMPARFDVAEKEAILCCVVLSVDEATGLATKIVRVQKRVSS